MSFLGFPATQMKVGGHGSARDDVLMPGLTDEIKKAYRKKVDIFRVSYNIIITHDFTGQGAPPCK